MKTFFRFKVAFMIAITAICVAGFFNYAWANELTKEVISNDESSTEKTEVAAPESGMDSMSEILGTRVIAQICIVVHDVEKTAKVYGDFFGLRYRITESAPYEVSKQLYNGQPTPARIKMAFFQLGDVQLEVVQPDEHPSSWREVLDKKGEGLHHIAFRVKDTPNVLKKLEDAGMQTQMTGNWETGCFAYVDAYDQLKFLLETLEEGYLFDGK